LREKRQTVFLAGFSSSQKERAEKENTRKTSSGSPRGIKLNFIDF